MFQQLASLLIALALLSGMAVGWFLGETEPDSVPDRAFSLSGTHSVEMKSGGELAFQEPWDNFPYPTMTPSPAPLVHTSTPMFVRRPISTPTPAPTEPLPAITEPLPATTVVAPVPTAMPTVAPVAPLPPPARIAGYVGHRIAPGENLEWIAATGGSNVGLIRQYNKLFEYSRPHCPLIVPYQEGKATTLPSQPLIIYRGCHEEPWVALTVDDCPSHAQQTGRMLQALRERHVRITFFVVGAHILAYPDMVRQIAADGHEFGNHSMSHPFFSRLNDAQVLGELAETERLLNEVAGVSSRPYFRFPYGDYNERVVHSVIAQGYLPIQWSIDSRDAVGGPKSPEYLVNVTTNRSVDELRGSIILMHCTSASTAEAFPAILDGLAAKGLEVRPLSDLLQ